MAENVLCSYIANYYKSVNFCAQAEHKGSQAVTGLFLHTPLWQFHTEKGEIIFKHKLNLRILKKLQFNQVKESLLSVHNYYLGKKAPEAVLQIAGNFKHL